jgi:hypothetical protein
MAFGDTRSVEIDREHIDYVANLPPQTRQLIELRDTLCHGSWQGLECKLSPDRQEELMMLKTYEVNNNVNLGLYLRLYLKQQKKTPA